MDLNKLRTQVFEKTGIKIDTSDPVFALVALNEAVLSECIAQHIAGLENATAQLTEQTGQLLAAGDRAKNLLIQMGKTVEEPETQHNAAVQRKNIAESIPSATLDSAPGSMPNQQASLPWRFIAGAVGIAFLSAVFVLLGQSIRGGQPEPKPKPAATASVLPQIAPKLTAEQMVLIQNGEKYARMWPKLDPKTQARIQTLSQ